MTVAIWEIEIEGKVVKKGWAHSIYYPDLIQAVVYQSGRSKDELRRNNARLHLYESGKHTITYNYLSSNAESQD
jgi:hypothetical protein